MLRSATINLRVNPAIRERLDRLSKALNRPRSYIVETALAEYLENNEWQVAAIKSAIAEADSGNAVWVEQEELETRWRAKLED